MQFDMFFYDFLKYNIHFLYVVQYGQNNETTEKVNSPGIGSCVINIYLYELVVLWTQIITIKLILVLKLILT